MSCFPCFGSQRSKRSNGRKTEDNGAPIAYSEHEMKKQKAAGETRNTKEEIDTSKIDAKTFTFRELATATKNFRQECLLGEGGFGRVYKGTLQSSGKVVAVKQLDRNGMEGNKEFLGEVLTLSNLYHPNLVHLIGYCADGDQRLLVHEYISGGTVDNHVLGNGPDHKALDWYTRVKIAYGAAMALEYLHDANPPIIYRDLKSSNILLDENLNPKLSGLAKLGPDGDKMHGPSRLMDTYGFCAPEISRTGEVTLKSDVYSFGLILLELITGRRAVDTTRPNDEQNLVSWAQPLFRDPKKFPDMADPLLNRQFPEKDLNQAVAIAAMCLQEEAGVRPLMSDVVATLSFLSTTPPPPSANPAPPPADPAPSENHDQDQNGSKCDSSSSDDDDDQDPDAAGDDEDEDEGSDNESVSRSQNHSRRSINDTSEEEGSEDEPQEGVVSESKEWHSFSNSSQKGNSMDGSTVSSSCRSSSKRSSASSSRKGDQNLDATVGNTTSSRSKSKSKSKCASVTSRSSSKGSTQGSVSYTRASSRRTSSTKEESAVSSGSICSTTEEESPKNVDAHQNSSRGSEQDGTIVS